MTGYLMPSIKYHYGKFSPKKIDWNKLIPLIGPTNAAIGRYGGTLTAISNSSITDTTIALNSENIMSSLQKKSQLLQMGKLSIQCIYPKLSKSIIDQIDVILAKHHSFTKEELDFIINYDIKYLIGKELDADSEGTIGIKSMENKGYGRNTKYRIQTKLA